MKIVIIGFMGAGKSTVGRLLSSVLTLPFFEMDDVIVERSGYGSVPEIFDRAGEDRFRQLEQEVARELGKVPSGIVSTGGGAAMNPDNREALSAHRAVIIHLLASFETLQARIRSDDSRPLFRDPAAALALYHVRLRTYAEFASLTITTDAMDPEQIVSEIQDYLHREPA